MIKKTVSIIVMLILCVSLCACEEKHMGDQTETIHIDSQYEAIERVKEGDEKTTGEFQISGRLFNCDYEDVEWGNCDATKNADGSWKVVLRGNMTGNITEEYGKKRVTYSFEYAVTVQENGVIDWNTDNVRKIKD